MNGKKKIVTLTGVSLAATAGVVVSANEVKAAITSDSVQDKLKSQTAYQQAQAKVDQAQGNANLASQATSVAQSQLNSANAANSAAQAAVNIQQGIVDNAQAKINDAESSVSAAQDAEIKARQNIEQATPANIQKVQVAIANQEAQISKETSAVNNANKAVSDAQSTVDAAQKKVNDATAARDAQQKSVDAASDAVQNAQATVDIINDKLANFNTITLPNGYKEAITGFIKSKDNSNILTAIGQNGIKNNQYKSNKDDQKVSVDYNKLTEAQRQELSIFATGLVNQVQLQMGTPKTGVSPKSVEFANEVVKEAYNDPSWDGFGPHMIDGKSHNNNGLQKVSSKMNGNGVLENMSSSIHNYTYDNYGNIVSGKVAPQTMDSLKRALYNDIIGMMFNDAASGWGHALTFINFGKKDWSTQSIDNETMGVAFDKYGYSHFVFTGATSANGFGDNEFAVSSNDKLISGHIPANTDFQSMKTNQTSKYNDTAQNSLYSAKRVLIAVPNYVTDRATGSQTAKDNLTTAQNDLVILQSRLKAEQERLAIAQSNLDGANKALSDANNNLAQKKQVVENDKKVLKTDNDKLVQLQNHLSDLKNAPKLLFAAKKQLATAQKVLADAQKAYNVANEKLASLKQAAAGTAANVSEAQQALEEAKNNEDAAKEALNQAQQALAELRQKRALAKQVAEEQTKLAAEKEAKDNGYHIENNQVVDAKGNIVAGWTVKGNQIVSPANDTVDPDASITTNVSVDSKGRVKPQFQDNVVTNEGKNTVNASTIASGVQNIEQYKQHLKSTGQLPQTGNESNLILALAGMALGIMISLFGLTKSER